MTTATRQARRGKGRKPQRKPLDREVILDAAAGLIEEVGLPAFSMRGLGAALGVEAMSLYHWFPSKAHLCDALLDRILAAIPLADSRLPWGERLRAEALAWRAALVARPAFAGFALTHRLNTRAALAYIERVAALFSEGGVPADLAARQFRTLSYYVSGALLDETAGYARGPTAADPVGPEEQRAIAPALLAFGPWFAPAHWERTFLFGLDVLAADFERQRAALERR